jgi:hypothetical protein
VSKKHCNDPYVSPHNYPHVKIRYSGRTAHRVIPAGRDVTAARHAPAGRQQTIRRGEKS